MAIHGFYWLIEGRLAGCGRPGGMEWRVRIGRGANGGANAAHAAGATQALDDDLDWLREQGIGAVLSMTETPLAEGALERHGLAGLHVPVDDMTAPTPEQFEQALGFIDRQQGLGYAVAVHCLMGQGRTGTILAAYLIRAGATPEAALRELRRVCPGAVENAEQEKALRAFAIRRDWII
jgi:atypical dual specificity phosphatase